MLRKMEGGDGGAQRSGTWRRTDRPLTGFAKRKRPGSWWQGSQLSTLVSSRCSGWRNAKGHRLPRARKDGYWIVGSTNQSLNPSHEG